MGNQLVGPFVVEKPLTGKSYVANLFAGIIARTIGRFSTEYEESNVVSAR